MKKKYWSGEWPNLNNLALAIPPTDYGLLSAMEYGVFVRLVQAIAAQCVNSQFSEISQDPKLLNDNATLSRIAGCTIKEFKKIASQIEPHFKIDAEYWRLRDEGIILILKDTARAGLSKNTKNIAIERQGEHCVYCGDREGPFHFDHLYPHVRGGSDEPNNIVLACRDCNLSKGSKTLREWMESR